MYQIEFSDCSHLFCEAFLMPFLYSALLRCRFDVCFYISIHLQDILISLNKSVLIVLIVS